MAKDPNFVSVRLPDDVAELLRQYAIDKKLVRSGNPNMGGSIIAILRAALQGETISNNVGQPSAASDVDIDSKINKAIAPLLARLEALETVRSEAATPANFTQALLQRAKEVAPLKLKEVA